VNYNTISRVKLFLILFARRSPQPAAIPLRNNGLQNAAMPEAIVPCTVSGLDDRGFLARTAVVPGSLLGTVRRKIWAVDSSVAVVMIHLAATALALR
jgi:hypothetical protein